MKTSVIIILCLFVGLKIAELIWPLRRVKRNWQRRMVINLVMAALVFTTAAFTIKPVSEFMVAWSTTQQFGLLHWLHLPLGLQFIIGFLLMDLSFYYWHWVNHNVPLLWRFHNVHHIDPDLDVTTSFRFHIVEIAYSIFFRIVQLFVIGVNPAVLVSYAFWFQANTFFQHSNIKLPLKLERILNYFIVTPRMHGIHHSQYMNETNANYSVIFSIWDRLHRTLRLNIPQNDINIGVPGYVERTDNKLQNLLLMPFQQQRNYWPNENIDRKLVTSAKTFMAD